MPLMDGVSIHAPTRGATRAAVESVACLACFNPRAHAGRDPAHTNLCAHRVGFQSTRPRGARPRVCWVGVVQILFQSTRPRGARPYHMTYLTAGGEFQSTRPRGARPCEGAWGHQRQGVSIHAPTRGATRRNRSAARSSECFNPRAHAGRDRPDLAAINRNISVSIHAPTRGATLRAG